MAEYASALVERGRRPAIAGLRLPSPFALSWILSALLVAAFELKVPSTVLWALALGILACGARLMQRRPIDAIAILPVISLIGPITSLGAATGASVQLGDLYLALIFAYFMVARGLAGRIALGPERVRIGAIIILTFIGWCFSIDVMASIVPVIGLLQFLLVYVVTLNTVRDRKDAERVLWGWVGAVALSSALIISAYVRGEALLLGVDQAYQSEFRSLTLTSDSFLFRATFFVPGVIFPLGAATAMTAVLLLFPQRRGWLPQVALGVFLATDLLAMGLLGNKTAMFATAVGAILMVAWTSRSRFGALRVTAAAGVVTGMLLVGFALIREVMTPAQLLLFFNRLGEGASFWERTVVWRRVAEHMIESPHALYLGLGPEMSIRRVDHPLFNRLFYAGASGQGGAVDSGYVYVVINYGILNLLLIMSIVLAAWRMLTNKLLNEIDWIALSMWLCITIWMIMMISQQSGVSKPVLMIIQVLAVCHALRSKTEWFVGRDVAKATASG